MKYRILIEQDEDGYYVAECPSLPGCISQGKTRAEALKNVEDAIKGYIESLKKHNEPMANSQLIKRLLDFENNISEGKKYHRENLKF